MNASSSQHSHKALIAACPPALVGPAWDPIFADGHPVASAMKTKEVKSFGVATFEC